MALELFESTSDRVWYRPDIEGNRALPAEHAFAVEISPMTAAEHRRSEERLGLTKLGKRVNFTARYNALREDVLRHHVHAVRGLRISREKDGQRVAEDVTDVGGLLELGNPQALETIVEDIYSAIKDHSLLEDGLLGKSA
jgi:hypothetical protein